MLASGWLALVFNGASETGVIEGVLMKEASFEYQVKDQEDFVEEHNILNAYRPVKTVTRKTKTKTLSNKKTSGKFTHSEASVSQ